MSGHESQDPSIPRHQPQRHQKTTRTSPPNEGQVNDSCTC
ncbi:hypothetical protein PSHT_03985 [Puccinia striiformis]|uniref:Uncharacterized protein n=1 Tax=Puccinia striiformis TaxID=27350 RepID=A0A2S4WE05_9BASI|nr:hypothetical protein PSHT_03985 [Puccinia striiformis]